MARLLHGSPAHSPPSLGWLASERWVKGCQVWCTVPIPLARQPGAGRRQAATSFDEGRPIEGENKAPFKSLPDKNQNFSEPHEQVSLHVDRGGFQKGCGPPNVNGQTSNASHVIWFSARPDMRQSCVFGLVAWSLCLPLPVTCLYHDL
jgi:hypothetical protein